MSYEEAIKAINEISARLGATATDLCPKLVKYGIMSNSICFIISLLSFIVSVFVLKKYGKEVFKTDDFLPFFLAIVGLIVFIVSAVFCFASIYDLLLWIFCPEMQAIDYILKCI